MTSTPHLLRKLLSYRHHPIVRQATITLSCALIFHYTASHISSVSLTHGPSMLPTMSVVGEQYYISKHYRRGRNIHVGDVVSYKHPLVEDAGAIKRVVGMPGDFVATGEKLGGEDAMIQVPAGHCWLLGDNLTESRDSRVYGPVPLALIVGKVIARVWPLGEIGWVENSLQRPLENV